MQIQRWRNIIIQPFEYKNGIIRISQIKYAAVFLTLPERKDEK